MFKEDLKKVRTLLKKVLQKIFDLSDFVIPKRNDYWIFPVYFLGKGNFSDNILAVFNQVKDDPNIKKIILQRENNIIVDGVNVVVVPMRSFKGTFYLLRSSIIIVQHSIFYELRYSLLKDALLNKRKIINLWHGIPVKDISNIELGFMNKDILLELPSHHIVTSSSRDKINMIKTFYEVKEENFWITGLPRNDFLIIEEKKLSTEIKKDILNIREKVKGKKLLVYMPTYRDYRKEGYYYNFSSEEIRELQKYLEKNNAVLGLRYHPYNKPIELIDRLQKEKYFLDLSEDIVMNTVAIIREASVIITDYSSLFLDALYIQKRTISFAYDYNDYMQKQHGFFYDFKEIFPGDIAMSFEDLIVSLYSSDISNSAEYNMKIKGLEALFFKYIDTNNSQRVVDKVKELVFE